jgi:hypothetical protein
MDPDEGTYFLQPIAWFALDCNPARTVFGNIAKYGVKFKKKEMLATVSLDEIKNEDSLV